MSSATRPAVEGDVALAETRLAVEAVRPDGQAIQEVVGDKGYHSNQSLVDLDAVGIRSYIAEPDRGRRNWKENPTARDAVYRNRRRIRGPRGLRLLRLRGRQRVTIDWRTHARTGVPVTSATLLIAAAWVYVRASFTAVKAGP